MGERGIALQRLDGGGSRARARARAGGRRRGAGSSSSAHLCSKRSWWENKRLAHLWEDGWDTSTFRRKFGGRLAEGAPNRYFFFYATDRTEWSHTLPINEYGAGRTWVVFSK